MRRSIPNGLSPRARAAVVTSAVCCCCSLLAPYEHTGPGSRTPELAIAAGTLEAYIPTLLPRPLPPPPVATTPPISSTGSWFITEAELATAWEGEEVACVRADGTVDERAGNIPIVDDDELWFADEVGLIDKMPAETRAWLGDSAWVIVIWDPNACEYEDWSRKNRNRDWASAGLLIRGAWLSDGGLYLGQEVTVQDINLVDTRSRDGAVKDEVALVTDERLPVDYPQLAQPVLQAKISLLAAAHAR